MYSEKTNFKRILSTMHTQYIIHIKRVVIVLLAAGLFAACDSLSDFGDMNENPTQVTESAPDMQFSTIQLSTAGTRYEMWRTQLLYGSNTVQHLVNAFYIGGNNYSENVDWMTSFWNTNYSGTGLPTRASIKNVEDLIASLEASKEDGEAVDNMLASARIMRAFIYHRVTDLYGDAPYSEAGRGALEQEFTPAYDKQQDIYNDMFTELDEAVNQFDASQPTFGSNDLMYGGDIAKWQKFANSLRLRLALRLVKVDLATAENEALAAVNAPGGVMESNDDIAMVQHEDGDSGGPAGLNTNAISEAMTNGGDHEFVAQTLVNWLDDRDDPRLDIYAQNETGTHLGFPSGYTGASVSEHPSYTGDVSDYSRVNEMLIDLNDPTFFQTYAEVEFMLAELAARNWTADDAENHYNAGVRAAMEYLTLYDGDGGAEIADSDINSYLANNPFNTGGTVEDQLEQINEQYWAAVFLNGIEAWSNWRRSGYPDLEPALVDSNDPPEGNNTNGEIPRRLMYPEGTESVLNARNYNDVIDRQGENSLVTRVWWDVE